MTDAVPAAAITAGLAAWDDETVPAVAEPTVRAILEAAALKPDELARCVLRLAMEGERDPVRLHDDALKGLIPATSWREAG